ncbi:MAG: hypothetical protein EOP61_41040, partial [Sphingomonadales bacterium]
MGGSAQQYPRGRRRRPQCARLGVARMTYEKILYRIEEDVAVIRLNDPAKLNAVSGEMGLELLDAIQRGAREARAILFGAEGRGFCSGADLTGSGIDVTDPARDVGKRLDGIFNPIIYQMRAAEVPIVTAIRGPAAGVGCAFALAGDLIVAGE